MKAYPENKKSGIDWLGNVPKHWEILRLKRFSSIVNGSTPKSSTAEYWDGDIVWVTPVDLGGLKGGKVIADSARKITKTGLNNCGASITPGGSIILSTRAPIGHLAITGIETCTNQGCKTIVPNQNQVSNSYLYYYLFVFKEILQSLGQGSTFVELSGQNLKDFVTAFPPFHEQQTIKEFLDSKIVQIDTLIANKQHQIELLQEYRTALINQAVTKGLDPTAPMKDSGEEWLGKIPSHWKAPKLKYIATVLGRIGWRGLTTQDYVDDGFILLGIRNISNQNNLILDDLTRIPLEKYDESPEIKVKVGDVLLAKTGATIGKSCIINNLPEPMTVNAAINILRALPDMYPNYLNYLITSGFLQSQIWLNVSENARGNIFQRDIVELIGVLPPIDEQVEIAHYLDTKLSEIYSLIFKVEHQIEQLQEYRMALLSEAVTGKIDVRMIG
jgi:type I restriction enzyme S subunit